MKTTILFPCLRTVEQEAIPSAISSGDTTDFQTWDIAAWTDAIQLRPKFGSVGEWISIKEVRACSRPTEIRVKYCITLLLSLHV